MTKIKQPVVINGVKTWITANSAQEFADKVLRLSGAAAKEETKSALAEKHKFSEYAWNWYHTYSAPNIETVTGETYRRQLTLYILPALGNCMVEDVTVDQIQQLFNLMDGRAKATKDKVRTVLNQILEAAVEDKLLPSNPIRSKKLKITGSASKETQTYTVEEMRYIVAHIGDVKNPTDRAYIALQALHTLRLEEVLGLKWGDISLEDRSITIRRAVTHPDRNRPEIKETKTEKSVRVIGLAEIAARTLQKGADDAFVIGGKAPLSYTQVRRMCERIREDMGFAGKITPIRFRTTTLTDLYDQTKDIKLTQYAAGHTTSAMTLKHYVKGRGTTAEAVAAIERVYAG